MLSALNRFLSGAGIMRYIDDLLPCTEAYMFHEFSMNSTLRNLSLKQQKYVWTINAFDDVYLSLAVSNWKCPCSTIMRGYRSGISPMLGASDWLLSSAGILWYIDGSLPRTKVQSISYRITRTIYVNLQFQMLITHIVIVKCNIKWNTSLQLVKQITNQNLNSPNKSHISPWRANYGMYL